MKPGRNDPCPCGSGKKYKQCCHDKVEIRSGFQPLRKETRAVALVSAAKGREPTTAETNQILALFNAGHHVELEIRARLLVEQYPDSGFIWNALGISLQVQGKDALPALQKATELLPDDAEALNNLGVALKDLGRLDEAMASYRRALKIKPNFAMAHCNLGNALQALGQLDGAVASCRKALEIKPNIAEAHNNLGITLQALGQLDGAVASYRRALEIKPDYAEAHSNLGSTLKDLGQLDGAEASYRRALEIKPNFAMAHYNLGNTLKDLGQFDDAVASYRRALEIKPDYAEAHSNLGSTLKDIGQFEDAVANYRKALEIKPDLAATHSNLLSTLNYVDNPHSYYLEEARRFGHRVVKNVREPFSAWPCAPTQPDRLRVGLVSADLRNHPVGYFLENLLTHIDQTRMELIAYPANSNEDELTARIKPCFTAWKPLAGLGDESAARMIHSDAPHVLLDISGHTAHNRLPMFAWKPAPVQASWLGYFATTGVATMDYLIADPWTVPDAEETHFTEKIWRLPETYLCFTPPDVDLQVAPLPALTNGHVTFGCFNNLIKMNDAVVALWARVLQAVPESRLFLKTELLGEAAMRSSVINRFAALGIDAGRLILEGASPRAELLASYQKVDIALDPFPYPGGTTSVEALWMGVPVITKRGDRFISHVGETIAHNAGLPDWVAANENEYVAKAVIHASDLDSLARLRMGLRQQILASPLFDAARFARHFEEAVWGMWHRWLEQRREA